MMLAVTASNASAIRLVSEYRLRVLSHSYWLALAIVVLAACGGTDDQRAICGAVAALRGALAEVAAARESDRNGDAAGVAQRMANVQRLLRVVRADLVAATSGPSTDAVRGLSEAANYIDFMIGDYRQTGSVDYALTQFAEREVNRAAAGGGASTPINC
jgi:hypothetical protein